MSPILFQMATNNVRFYTITNNTWSFLPKYPKKIINPTLGLRDWTLFVFCGELTKSDQNLKSDASEVYAMSINRFSGWTYVITVEEGGPAPIMIPYIGSAIICNNIGCITTVP